MFRECVLERDFVYLKLFLWFIMTIYEIYIHKIGKDSYLFLVLIINNNIKLAQKNYIT